MAFGIHFKVLRKDHLLSLVEKDKPLKIIATVNAEFIILANEDERFKRILNDNISVIDGQIPYLLIKLRHPSMKIEKLSGSSVIYDICEKAAELRLRVFLLGGTNIANDITKKRLKSLYPNLVLSGYSPPYCRYPFLMKHNQKIINVISKFKPDVLFVAFGPPKQEFWIDDNKIELEKIGVRLAMGVGGTFEIISGIEKKAPKFVQQIGFEGIWRLCQNPKRYKRFLNLFNFFKYISL